MDLVQSGLQALANALQFRNMVTGKKLDIPDLLLGQYPFLKELMKKSKKGQPDLFEKKIRFIISISNFCNEADCIYN